MSLGSFIAGEGKVCDFIPPWYDLLGRPSLASSSRMYRTFRLSPLVAALISTPVFADSVEIPPVVAGQTVLQANEVNGVSGERVHARGDVVVTRDDRRIDADWLDYYQDRQRLLAGDRVTLTRGGDRVVGRQLDYLLESGQGVVQDAHVTTQTSPLRAEGATAHLFGEGRYSLDQARVTSCAPGRDDWYIRAKTIDIDDAKNIGVARHSVLEFMGVPILYTPYIDFPVHGGRKSGLLAPELSTRSESGLDFSVPYYFNLAPNYDLTLAPRYMSKRGLMLGGEFRYMEPSFKGQISAERLNRDEVTGEARDALRIEHAQALTPELFFQTRIESVSDRDYFRDFGSRMSIASNVNLPREASLTWSPGWGVVQLRTQRYQTLQDQFGNNTVEEPYARLPQLLFATAQSLPYGLQTSFNAEYVDFAHSSKQEGRRLTLNPSISLPWRNSWAYVTPKVSLNYRQYQLDAYGTQAATSRTVTTPVVSVDAGMTFERNSHFFGDAAIQTLEPRLFYVNAPYRNQSDLPLFDTSEYNFDFAQLFAENRFSGGDRLADANALTAAVTSRVIDEESGIERFRVSLGQRYSFTEPKVTLNGRGEKRFASDFLANVSGQLTRNVSLSANYQFNPELKKTERYAFDLRYQPAPGKTLSARYRYGRDEIFYNTNSRDTLRQIDLAAQWPIARNWYVVARENYSLKDRRSLEHLVGVEYHAGCWSVRAVAQRYVVDERQSNNAIFFQLELNELGGLGSNPLETLRLAIPGYSKINQIP